LLARLLARSLHFSQSKLSSQSPQSGAKDAPEAGNFIAPLHVLVDELKVRREKIWRRVARERIVATARVEQ
jgi:hypothetical protein